MRRFLHWKYIFILDIAILVLAYFFVEKSLFDLDKEHNVPTLFQTIKLLSISSFFLLSCWTAHALKLVPIKALIMYGLVGVFFLLLGLDEIGQIHEHLSIYLNEFFPEQTESYISAYEGAGYKSSEWLLFYWPVVVCFAIVSVFGTLRILRPYSNNQTWILLLGIVLFLAVPVVEYINTGGGNTVTQEQYRQLVTVEEALEMFGASMFFVASESIWSNYYAKLREKLNT